MIRLPLDEDNAFNTSLPCINPNAQIEAVAASKQSICDVRNCLNSAAIICGKMPCYRFIQIRWNAHRIVISEHDYVGKLARHVYGVELLHGSSDVPVYSIKCGVRLNAADNFARFGLRQHFSKPIISCRRFQSRLPA